MTTVAETLTRVAETLRGAGIEAAAREARILVAHAMGVPPDRLTLLLRDRIDVSDEHALNRVMPRRLAREPLSHITGVRQFWKNDFSVTADVLDPRPETELLVEVSLREAFEEVLDLGTGSGAILISILLERPNARGVGVDVSDAALAVARRNLRRHGLTERARLLKSDWFEKVQWRFDLIVANPPYIGADEMTALAPELAYEPRIALTDGADGLSAYRMITAHARRYLAPGGRLLVEIGASQADAVSDLFARAGLETISIERDLDGRERAIAGRNPD